MNFKNISAWCIRNPVPPIVLFIGLTLAGLVAFMRMDVQDTPDIEFPVVIASISQPGAAPTEIENQITQLVESSVRTLTGVRSISSTANEGSSTTVVEFEMGTDVNQSVNEVKNAIDQIRGELPDGILEPFIEKETTSSNPIAYYAVAAPDMTIEQLSWFVDDAVAKRLLAINGMAQVQRNGGVDREIRVILDPARMQSLGVTASQVNSALRQLNVNAAGGRAEIAGSRQSVRVLGNAVNAYELSQTQIQLPGGRTVQLADIASVSDSFGEQQRIGKIRGAQVVNFSMARAKGASDVTVYDNAVKELEKIEKENPGIKFTELFTSVDYTKQQYSSSMLAMVEGAVLAVLVVFLFLRDTRATLISAIAIPLSAIPAFWFMDLMGITLNSLSLLALGLVAGVLVDDAIVEIENIVRHMRMGKSAYQASIDAADEIGLAVLATTMSIVAVFLPVAMMPGISGQFFKNFGYTVVLAVLMSLFVARMITPLIAAYFLKAHGAQSHGEGKLMDYYMSVLRWSLDSSKAKAMRAELGTVPLRPAYWFVEFFFILLVVAAFGGTIAMVPKLMTPLELPAIVPMAIGFVLALVAGYLAVKLLGLAIRAANSGAASYHDFITGRWTARFRDHRIWIMGIGFLSFVATIGMFMSLPSQFFPTTNSDFSRLRIEMLPGTTIEQTEAVADQVADIINEQPETLTALESIREGNANIFITLKKDRERSSIDYERDITPQLAQIPDARVSFMSQSGGGGTGRDISIMLSGSDPVLLNQTASKLVDEMSNLKEIRAPRVNADLRRPELLIKPQLDLAAQLGVTTTALSQTIRIATMGDIDQNSAKFSLSDRQVPIRVMLPENSRRDLETIRNLPVPTTSGGSVPLSRVAEISFGSGPTTIQRYNQNRRIFVGADLAPNVVKSEAMAKINALPTMTNLPTGVSNAPFGDDEWQAEMMNGFLVALVSGVMLVFGVLVLLYRRFMSPLVNMGSLLLAPLGGLIALAIIGQPLSLPVFIGILMLFGIVAKNSILLVDFAVEMMDHGMTKFEALMEAGHKRAQPIVMTTVAMVAGMVPTAVSLSGDGAWRAPMGTVVIGGLILSTLLTLLIVPAGFSLADGLEKRVGPWLRKRVLTLEHGHEDPGRMTPQPAE
ncbi:efflux RND transporter permease subunit [Sphingomonas sp. NSE70-1]|uniref:Efflux RND transporter permease subunit n=1 Tax=Sphingomonas caseinilyticus TaxID=2908205 RepID=A0ABT0RU00_9SPHN|nr:efflux RND transporter permease subunit [Sphingomonas caseinilyticus]MCL6698426.1 efflux RND transporter permease subunit [Sphingomonas caseinilyticus]